MKTGKMILTIIVSVAILIVAGVLSQMAANLLAASGVPAWVCNMTAGLLYIAFAYILVWLFCTKYLREEMTAYAIPKCRAKVKWAVAALLLPGTVSGVYLLFPGNFAVNPMDTGMKLALVFSGIFYAGLGAGIVEELLFRGLLMNVVIKRFGRTAGIVAPSVLFASLHIVGRKFSLLSYAQVIIAGTLVGIMFSLITLEGRSVWNSAIVHAVWNLVIVGGVLTIGTEFDQYALYSYQLKTASVLLTGGEFGIESSAVSILGYLVVSLAAIWMMRRRKNNG